MAGGLRHGMGRMARKASGLLAALLRRSEGAAAIEFAIIAIPFLGLTFAIIETTAMIFTDSVVQGAVTAAARKIRVGNSSVVPAAGASPTQQAAALSAFQTEVCNDVYNQISCSNLFLDVRSFTSFSGITIPAPTFDNQGNVTNTSFSPGASSVMAGSASIITVRVIYVWNTITPGLSYILGAGAGQPYTMTYTVVLRSEPY